MEDIIEQYGLAFLQIIGGAGTAAILLSCIRPGGILNTVVLTYMSSLCG